MRERTAIRNGKFFLRSEKGKGTRIRIEIPIKDNTLSNIMEPMNFLQEIYETKVD